MVWLDSSQIAKYARANQSVSGVDFSARCRFLCTCIFISGEGYAGAMHPLYRDEVGILKASGTSSDGGKFQAGLDRIKNIYFIKLSGT